MNKFLLSLGFITLIHMPESYAFEGLDLNESEFHTISKKFVNNETLNIRSNPINGKVIGKLDRGDEVYIYDISQDWSRISQKNDAPKWVSSKYLCSADYCFNRNYSTTKITSSTSKDVSMNKNYQHKKTTQTYSGSCSCSSGSFCYGPRGGRYCYTSGGNKSYR